MKFIMIKKKKTNKTNHENSLFRQIFKTANKNSLKVVNDTKEYKTENKTKRTKRLTLFSTNNQ